MPYSLRADLPNRRQEPCVKPLLSPWSRALARAVRSLAAPAARCRDTQATALRSILPPPGGTPQRSGGRGGARRARVEV